MNRRDTLLALLALSAVPLTADAQERAKPARIAWLSSARPEDGKFLLESFRQGLRDLGHVENGNIVIEFRWASYKTERLVDLAKELVALKPDVILATSTISAQAAQKATTTLPIVVASGDPLAMGLVKSLARPGGNLTGVANLLIDTSPKLVELLLTVLPKLSRTAVVWNSSSLGSAAALKNLQAAAQGQRVNILPFDARTPDEIENVFAGMRREQLRAFIVAQDALFFQRRQQIAQLAGKNRMASIFAFRENVEAGGLISYGSNLGEGFRRAATYVDKILKGAKPADLPVEQATRFELVVNRKTAKALGITIPASILLRADRVIE